MFNRGKTKELEEAVDKARQEAAWYKTCYEFEKKWAQHDAKINAERLERIDELNQKVRAETQRGDALAKSLSAAKKDLDEMRQKLAVEHTYIVWVGDIRHEVRAFDCGPDVFGVGNAFLLYDREGEKVATFYGVTGWEKVTASGDTSR